jgi:catechol 2,3-dioxygenase-like lactoylglutathione lyase family enzyme
MLKAIRHLDYIVLLCDDIPRMKRFYHEIMRFPIYRDWGDWVELRSPGTRHCSSRTRKAMCLRSTRTFDTTCPSRVHRIWSSRRFPHRESHGRGAQRRIEW